jgi:hypothetical protein
LTVTLPYSHGPSSATVLTVVPSGSEDFLMSSRICAASPASGTAGIPLRVRRCPYRSVTGYTRNSLSPPAPPPRSASNVSFGMKLWNVNWLANHSAFDSAVRSASVTRSGFPNARVSWARNIRYASSGSGSCRSLQKKLPRPYMIGLAL